MERRHDRGRAPRADDLAGQEVTEIVEPVVGGGEQRRVIMKDAIWRGSRAGRPPRAATS